ncbi:hypothetical protein SCLCIDRAFT_571398 [Scleroderma citrinum Foug A]|uniref:Uncharacterized protein n=1 Tax=Scleroderma citrinum Foug A TaxID=1036808 RepID=A0A0C2YRF4_9AGAM|nr:hypothetical protein SCLCIDRAFT_571398 [Scleroderma citrinum Foug A]
MQRLLLNNRTVSLISAPSVNATGIINVVEADQARVRAHSASVMPLLASLILQSYTLLKSVSEALRPSFEHACRC